MKLSETSYDNHLTGCCARPATINAVDVGPSPC